jgi:hypothetical protein
MAKELVTASLVAPAFLGLNTQESSLSNDPSFALDANNCVIDEFGRLGAREGWFYRKQNQCGLSYSKLLLYKHHLLVVYEYQIHR